MKARKFKVTLEIEVLDTDSITGVASEALRQIEREFHNGKLTARDGDTVKWTTESKDIEF